MLIYSAKRLCIYANCRKSFIRNLSTWRSSNHLTIDNQNKMKEEYRATFNSAQIIDRGIVLDEKFVQLSYLTKIYTKSLSKTLSTIIITVQKI